MLALPSSVYCVQGILGLSRLALSFFFKDELQIEPAQVRSTLLATKSCSAAACFTASCLEATPPLRPPAQHLQAAFLMGLSSLPWMIKPLYGFISDSVPLFGYRRRSYLVACGILGAHFLRD